MVKSRGCSCWPFIGQKVKKGKEPVSSNSSQENSQIRSRLSHSNFMNSNQNSNVNLIQRINSQQNNLNTHRSRTLQLRNQAFQDLNRVQLQVEEYNNTDEIRKRNKVRIKTHISKRDVRYLDDYPLMEEEQNIYKYCCPICLRYFNYILISTCCKNYICRFCIGDMAKKAKLDRNFVIKCSHCFEVDFKLEDVKVEDTIKFYTDTPFKFAKTKGQDNDNLNNKKQESPHFKLNEEESYSQVEVNNFNSPPLNLINNKNPQINLASTQRYLKNVLVGDNEHPDYESPYPFQSKLRESLQQENHQLNNEEQDGKMIPSEEEKQYQPNRQTSNINAQHLNIHNQEDIDDQHFQFLNQHEHETLETKMRELRDSRKSLIGERNHHIRLNEEIDFNKISESPIAIETDRQHPRRVSSAKQVSPFSYNHCTSLLKVPKRIDTRDIDSIMNRQILPSQMKMFPSQFSNTQNFQIGQEAFKVRQANFLQREVLNQRYNNDDKENISPNILNNIGIQMKTSPNKRQPLHEKYLKYNVNQQDNIQIISNQRNNTKLRSALVQVSQEIISPQSKVKKFELNESHIQLRGTSNDGSLCKDQRTINLYQHR